jgi:hypothetical protein
MEVGAVMVVALTEARRGEQQAPAMDQDVPGVEHHFPIHMPTDRITTIALPPKGSAEGLGIGGGGGGREQGTRSGRRPGRLKPNIGFPCSYCHVPVSQWKMVLMTLPALRWGGGLETGGEVQAGAAS